jgi:hypothetical protein
LLSNFPKKCSLILRKTLLHLTLPHSREFMHRLASLPLCYKLISPEFSRHTSGPC